MFNNHVVGRWLSGGLAIAAVSFPPAAQAMLPRADSPSSATGQSSSAIGLPVQSAGKAGQDGFQWGDAGIGAAGTVVLLGAGAAAARRHRVSRTVIG